MREATWSRVGTDISAESSVDQILRAAGLDYTVIKQPIFLENGIQIPDKMATVKEETGKYIGVVSNKYQIYQNDEAFGFIDSIPDIQFVKAGETHTGMVYIIGKLPSVHVLNDEFTPHVIFQTSHNGLFQIRATICPLRMVCQNQFALSFARMRNTISIHHSSQMRGKVAQAKELLADTAVYMNGFTNTAEELAMLKITDSDFYSICDAFFDSTKEITERQKKAISTNKELVRACYRADDNANFVGTAWGVVNAFTDLETHKPRKQTKTASDSAFTAVTFDTTTLAKLMSIVRERV